MDHWIESKFCAQAELSYSEFFVKNNTRVKAAWKFYYLQKLNIDIKNMAL